MPNPEIKIVEWRDASDVEEDNCSWFSREDAIKLAEKKYNEICTTIGYLLHNNKDYIVIASTKTGDLFADINMIPKTFVIEIKPYAKHKGKS